MANKPIDMHIVRKLIHFLERGFSERRISKELSISRPTVKAHKTKLQAFDNFARETLMDIIDERFQKLSTILSLQLPVSTWYEIIGESAIADAIPDRIVNSSHRTALEEESLRKGILKDE